MLLTLPKHDGEGTELNPVRPGRIHTASVLLNAAAYFRRDRNV